MCKHEEKICARCNKGFECKVGNIAICQCTAVKLTIEEQEFIEATYKDCLCIDCLKEIKNKYIFFKERMHWK